MTPKIRVYYNWRNTGNCKPWSYDYGDISTEQNVVAIEIGAYMVTGYNPDAPKGEPSGWLENFSQVVVNVAANGVLRVSDHACYGDPDYGTDGHYRKWPEEEEQRRIEEEKAHNSEQDTP